MDRRTREAVRYLGCNNHAVDDHTLTLIQSSFRELDRVADKRIIYRIFDLEINGDRSIKIGNMVIESKDLAKNLNGCHKVFLMGATLGIQVDRLMCRYSVNEMAKAAALQACAAALLEEYLDKWQEESEKDMLEQGGYLRPRFSPGYGDFSIGHQEMILRMLDAYKMIGLSVTDCCMLIPSKSVTAVVGIGSKDISCRREGCEVCDKFDCLFRRKDQRI